MTGESTPTKLETEARQLTRMMDEKSASKSIGIPAHLAGTAAESDEDDDANDGGTGPSNTLESIRSRAGSTFRTMDDVEREQTPLSSNADPVAIPGLLYLPQESSVPKRGVPTPRGNKRSAEMNFLGGVMTEMLDVMKGKRDQATNAANESRMSSLEDAFKASTEATNNTLSAIQQQVREPLHLIYLM